MKRNDLEVGDNVILKTKFIAEVVGFSERYVYVNQNDRIIRVHHTEIIRKNNGGRENGNGNRPSNGGSKVLESSEQ